MVWVEIDNADVNRWFDGWRRDRPHCTVSGPLNPWDLVEHFRKAGLIKGYILYRPDRSRGGLNEHRPGMDCSVNVATSLCGLLDGILIDESLEREAQTRGLVMLLDVRDKDESWCLENYKQQFHRRLLCTQDPKKPHARDLAIAHRAFTIYGNDVAAEAMRWLEPLSPILGWNGGDEFESTRLSTIHGHFQTATDWCVNLPVLMAGSSATAPPAPRDVDPGQIDWSDNRSAVSFVCSDGDNVQWLQTSFFGNGSYWGHADRGRIPFGWSTCFAHLSQLCPQAVHHAVATQSPNDGFLEWGGGYYYPDLFALERPDRWDLLARHARRTWDLARKTGTRIVGFNASQPGSMDARRAYEVFARETRGLLAIFVFQYAPYEGGGGATYWVRDRDGLEVPVLTARYSIWAHSNDRPRSGTPAKVAREIRQNAAAAPAGEPRYGWVIAHAWSYFRQSTGTDEDRENMAQQNALEQGGVRGFLPVVWCAERLPENVSVVRPGELAWRIRMQHDPEATRRLVEEGWP
jgi:hypothetical protein